MPRSDRSYDTSLAYRVFTVDSTGAVSRATELMACNDSDAIAQARQLVSDQAIELWRRGHRLVSLEAVLPAEMQPPGRMTGLES